MSELFMECVEEELEPWQKQVPEINLIDDDNDDDDDDEPIFVGVLCMSWHIFKYTVSMLSFKHLLMSKPLRGKGFLLIT